MIVHNRDMFPAEDTLRQFPDIAPLLTNDLLDKAFEDHDARATTAKVRYHRLGQIAVILIAGSAIFTLAEALIPALIPDSLFLRLPAVFAAGVGIGLQLYLFMTGQKNKWLLNRYATERIRSIKFQSFAMATIAESSDDLVTKRDAFSSKALARLNDELNGGISVLQTFRPSTGLLVLETANERTSEIKSQAETAYRELRILYQKRFAQSEIARYSDRRRFYNSTQDMVYLLAAAFTFAALGARVAGSFGVVIDTGWIEFLAVTCFILGATEAILDNALLEEHSQSRYEDYVSDIEDVETVEPTAPFSETIVEMERLALDELALFCSGAEKISYRF